MAEQVERPIAVEITEVATGQIRTYAATGYWEDGHFGDYIWSEGNFGCDCNRRLFFQRAADEDKEDGSLAEYHGNDTECGDGAFRVRILSEQGVVLYEDGVDD